MASMPVLVVSEIVPLIEYAGSALALLAPNEALSATRASVAEHDRILSRVNEFVCRGTAKNLLDMAPERGTRTLLAPE
jgi:hypothetical protein